MTELSKLRYRAKAAEQNEDKPKEPGNEEKEPLIEKEVEEKVHFKLALTIEKEERSKFDTFILLSLTVLSFITRYIWIGLSNKVVWDEAHFGKFASFYLKREFYFDVHPPLGKMLVAVGGLLAGYDGSFDFKSGELYPEGLNYTVMRAFLATFGALMVPVAFETAREMKFSTKAATFVGLMVLLDNAYVTISRFILLDSMLLFFTCLTFYCMICFKNQSNDPFSFDWWLCLVFTGISIGLVSSVKWVGFFVTALVGLFTIEQLWEFFGDLSIPKLTLMKHFFARVFGLIIIPMIVYMLSFKAHFAVLNHSGEGDSHMSSLFQANLIGNSLGFDPPYVAYGSIITLKNNGYGGALLHSHPHLFPDGSKQQQVTAYSHKDSNNDWTIQKHYVGPWVNNNTETEIEFIKDGDTVALIHQNTGRKLHSHRIPAALSKLNYEVSCYGDEEVGDSNDLWRIEVVDDVVHKSDKIHILSTRFKLRHVETGCVLRSDANTLPQWAYKQQEVSCDHRHEDSQNHLWNVENHINDKLEGGQKLQLKTNFFRDFLHLNVAMMTSNNALIPDADKEPEVITSVPRQWPFATVGLRMNSWDDDNIKFYLLGNPIIWWGGAVSLISYGLLCLWYNVRMQRRIFDLNPVDWEDFVFAGKMLLGGWLLHFIPFLIMGRVMYLHHYLPALYFAIFMFGYLLDRFTPPKMKTMVFATMSIIVIAVFIYFAPVCFGMNFPSKDFASRKWLSTWNICD